jgi:PAS domain S-box-containing protein
MKGAGSDPMRDFSNPMDHDRSPESADENRPSLQKPDRRRSIVSVTRLDPRRLSRNFLARVESPAGFDVLFEHLSDVYFFVKDGEGRFVRVNQGFMKLVRAGREDEVIGFRDSDFFPAEMAENYMRDDREVIRSSEPIIDKVELVRNPDGSIDWFCTTKLPLFDKKGLAIGVCGITRDVKKMNTNNARFLSWAPVLEIMLNDYAQPLSTAALAAKVSLSVSQFNRQFRKKFHTTPRAYLTNVRMNAACHLLVTTDLPISDISLQTGFYDQSHFSNQFVRHRGLPPSQYRTKYAQSQELGPEQTLPEDERPRGSSHPLRPSSKPKLSSGT